MLLEIVIVVTMLKYIQFVLARLGGAEQLVTRCNQEDVRLPLGEPLSTHTFGFPATHTT